MMRFVLKPENFTADAASLWGDVLGLDRPATYAEAMADFLKNDFGGAFADYFEDDGTPRGPCSLGIVVEQDEPL